MQIWKKFQQKNSPFQDSPFPTSCPSIVVLNKILQPSFEIREMDFSNCKGYIFFNVGNILGFIL